MKWKTQAKKFLVIAFLCVLLIIQVSAASGDTIVYVTNTGEKYHSYGCQYLRKSCISISLSSAVASGYTRCSKCNPPILDPYTDSYTSSTYSSGNQSSSQPASNSGTQSSNQASSSTENDEVLELKKKIDNLTGQISSLKDRNSYLQNQIDLFEEEWISPEEAESMVQDAVKEKEAEYQKKLAQQENANMEETVFVSSLFAIVCVFAGYLIKKAMDFPIIKKGENAVRAYQNQLNSVLEELNTVKSELNAANEDLSAAREELNAMKLSKQERESYSSMREELIDSYHGRTCRELAKVPDGVMFGTDHWPVKIGGKSLVVFINKAMTKYHKQNCSFANGATAINAYKLPANCEPCKICNPPIFTSTPSWAVDYKNFIDIKKKYNISDPDIPYPLDD